MTKLKFKVGDRVRIKSLDWYNKNKNKDGNVLLINRTNSRYNFIEVMRGLCGKVMTISSVYMYSYNMVEDNCEYFWTDEMIEGLVDEEIKPKYEDEMNGEHYSTPKYLVRPNGYQFVDENGNVIPATKIVLEKKKKEYPKTYEECLKILGFTTVYTPKVEPMFDYDDDIIALQKLKNCRNAYWKIAGEKMGLGKPWEPDYKNPDIDLYVIINIYNRVEKAKYGYGFPSCVFTFPTAEMRDAFYENFKELIEQCKELL